MWQSASLGSTKESQPPRAAKAANTDGCGVPGEAAGLVAEEIRGAMINGDAERAAFWMPVRARIGLPRPEDRQTGQKGVQSQRDREIGDYASTSNISFLAIRSIYFVRHVFKDRMDNRGIVTTILIHSLGIEANPFLKV